MPISYSLHYWAARTFQASRVGMEHAVTARTLCALQSDEIKFKTVGVGEAELRRDASEGTEKFLKMPAKASAVLNIGEAVLFMSDRGGAGFHASHRLSHERAWALVIKLIAKGTAVLSTHADAQLSLHCAGLPPRNPMCYK